MMRNLKHYDGNIVALEVIGGVTTADIDEFERQFAEKLALGLGSELAEVNIIINLDKLDAKATSLKAAWQERVWGVKNMRHMGNIALVGSKRPCHWLKKAIQLEARLLMAVNKNAHEKYFDISELDAAFAFVEARQQTP